MGNYRLEVRNLHKRFPGVYAIKGVSFQVAPGEVHALVGENGAGKSTLMKMITGEYTPDEGEIFHNGEQIKPKSIADSQKTGISMIHPLTVPLHNFPSFLRPQSHWNLHKIHNLYLSSPC